MAKDKGRVTGVGASNCCVADEEVSIELETSSMRGCDEMLTGIVDIVLILCIPVEVVVSITEAGG